MQCNVKSAIASAKANARVAEQLARKRNALDRGRGEWTDDDEEQLRRGQHDLSVAMCGVAVDMILPHLDAYRRPECPMRPPRLEREIVLEPDGNGYRQRLTGDFAVAYRINTIKKKQRLTPKDKRVMKLWTSHLSAVQSAEALGSSRSKALLTYLAHAERAGDTETAATLRGFLAREWGFEGDVPVDIDALAVELGRRRDVISNRLMYGDRKADEAKSSPRQICAGEVM